MVIINKRGKISLIAGTILFICHFVYENLWGKKSLRDRNKAKILE